MRRKYTADERIELLKDVEPTSIKLSQAIMGGSEKVQPMIGAYLYLETDGEISACALGAAAYFVEPELAKELQDDVDELIDALWPEHAQKESLCVESISFYVISQFDIIRKSMKDIATDLAKRGL